MNYPETWQQLVHDDNLSPVMPARAFRPGQEGYVQFVNGDDQEHLAVHSLNPYLHLNLPKKGDTQTVGFLPVEAVAEDYTMFAVAPDMLTLKQTSLGTGKRNVLQLKRPYHELGQAVGRLISYAPLPQLKLDDFAREKRTGKLILLPQIEVEKVTQDRLQQLQSIAQSISTTLSSHISMSIYEELIDEVDAGMRNQ